MSLFFRLIALALLICTLASAHATTPAPQPNIKYKISNIKSQTPDPAAVRSELTDILSADEYNRVYSSSRPSTYWTNFWKRAGRAIKSFLDWMRESLAPKGESAGRIASFIFAAMVIVGFIALMVLLIRRLMGGARDNLFDDDSWGSGSSYHLPSARPLIDQAEKLARSGDYDGAFRCAYMASISRLDEVGMIRFERGKTNWEYLRELDSRGQTSPREALLPLTPAFDRAVYNREQCREQDYVSAVAAYNRISEAIAA